MHRRQWRLFVSEGKGQEGNISAGKKEKPKSSENSSNKRMWTAQRTGSIFECVCTCTWRMCAAKGPPVHLAGAT